MCYTPLTLYRNYASMDGTKTNVVPCGKCPKCLRDRQNAWVFRLQQEQKISKSACFLTLTYADAPLSFNGHQTLEPKHLTDFWKRLRKQNTDKIKYFAVGEYGTKYKRPHYHAIVFNINQKILQHNDRIQNIWTHGYVDTARSSGASQRYTIGYIMQDKWQPEQDDDDRYPQFQRQSKNLGINYLSPAMVDYHVQNLMPVITQPGNQILKMPRYYKDKIFSKYEKQQIFQQYQKIHNLDWEQFLNHDFEMEVQQKLNKYREHEKINAQNKKHTF